MNTKTILITAGGAGVGTALMPVLAFAGVGLVGTFLICPACTVAAFTLRHTPGTTIFRSIIAATAIGILILLAIVVYMLFFATYSAHP